MASSSTPRKRLHRNLCQRKRPWYRTTAATSLMEVLPLLLASSSSSSAAAAAASLIPRYDLIHSDFQPGEQHHVRNPTTLYHKVQISSSLPWLVRGGETANGNGDSDDGLAGLSSSSASTYDDDTLDSYVDFLLAYAEGQVTEEDNPLLQGFPPSTSSSLSSLDDDNEQQRYPEQQVEELESSITSDDSESMVDDNQEEEERENDDVEILEVDTIVETQPEAQAKEINDEEEEDGINDVLELNPMFIDDNGHESIDQMNEMVIEDDSISFSPADDDKNVDHLDATVDSVVSYADNNDDVDGNEDMKEEDGVGEVLTIEKELDVQNSIANTEDIGDQMPMEVDRDSSGIENNDNDVTEEDMVVSQVSSSELKTTEQDDSNEKLEFETLSQSESVDLAIDKSLDSTPESQRLYLDADSSDETVEPLSQQLEVDAVVEDQEQDTKQKPTSLLVGIIDTVKSKMNDPRPADEEDDVKEIDINDVDINENRPDQGFWNLRLDRLWGGNQLKDDITTGSDLTKVEGTHQLELDCQSKSQSTQVDGDVDSDVLSGGKISTVVKDFFSDSVVSARNMYSSARETMSAFLAKGRETALGDSDVSTSQSPTVTITNEPHTFQELEDSSKIYNKYFSLPKTTPSDPEIEKGESAEESHQNRLKAAIKFESLKRPWGMLTGFLYTERKDSENSTEQNSDTDTPVGFDLQPKLEAATANRVENIGVQICEDESNTTVDETPKELLDDSNATFVFDVRAESENPSTLDVAINSGVDVAVDLRLEESSFGSREDVEESGHVQDSIYSEDDISELVETAMPKHADNAIDDEKETPLSGDGSVFKSVDEEGKLELEDGRDEDLNVDLELAAIKDNEDHSHDKEDELLEVVEEVIATVGPDLDDEEENLDVNLDLERDLEKVDSVNFSNEGHEKEDALLEVVEDVLDTVGPDVDVDSRLDFNENIEDENEGTGSLEETVEESGEELLATATAGFEEDVENDENIEDSHNRGRLEEDVDTESPEDEDFGLFASDTPLPAFVTRSADVVVEFLLARKLEHWIIISLLVFEWMRVYVIDPIVETFGWIRDGNARKLFQERPSEWISFRGGDADSSSSLDENSSSEGEPKASPDSAVETRPEEDAGSDSKFPPVDIVDSVESNDNQSVEDEVKPNFQLEKEVGASTEIPVPRRRVRPNRLYRMLLSYGYPGHTIIMAMIVTSEWLDVYVPAVPALANYVMYDVLGYRREVERGSSREDELSQTSCFLSADGTATRGGKKRKSQTKKDDQKALSQLRKLGNVNQARYRLLSESFMKRHNLGKYAKQSTRKAPRSIYSQPKNDLITRTNDEDEVEAESDSEWIVQALTAEEEIFEEEKSMFDTNVGVSVGSNGPAVTLGVDFSIGHDPRRKKKAKSRKRLPSSSLKPSPISLASSSISEAARQTYGSKRMSSGPRVSDSEGGMMSRLRAASANSLMGRNILGAYPGDLPSPEDAGDAQGLIELAGRYGYGDWSDDEYEDEDNDEAENIAEHSDTDGDESFGEGYDPWDNAKERNRNGSMNRNNSSSGKKKRKKKKTRSGKQRRQPTNTVSIGFDLTSSSQSSPLSVTSSATKTLRKKSTASSGMGASSSPVSKKSSKGVTRRKRVKGLTPGHIAAAKKGQDISITKRPRKSDISRESSSSKKNDAKTTPSKTNKGPPKSILLEQRKLIPPPATSVLKDVRENRKQTEQPKRDSSSSAATGKDQDTK